MVVEPDPGATEASAPAAPPRANIEPPPFTKRIGTRLTALVAVGTLTAYVAAVYLGLGVQERNMVKQAIDGAALFGDSITRATHDQMLRGRKDEAYKVIDEIGGLERVEKVRLFNKEGKVTFSTDHTEIGAAFGKSEPFCGSCHGPERPIERPLTTERARISRTANGRVLGFITPIYNEPACAGSGCHAAVSAQRVLGVVDVTVSLAPVDRELAALRWKTLAAGLVVTALLTGLILYSTRRYILKPVKTLVAATREIARGNLDKPVRHHSSDEFGMLAESFDGMRLSLRSARAEIDDLMTGLERQVEDRTADLKRAQAQLIQGEKLASLGKLSASIAHEINNPLAGILTFAKLISRDLEQGEIGPDTRDEAVKRLKLVQRETERCSAIVRNLLDFARQRPADLKDVDVNAALEESLHLVAHQVELAGHTLETHLGAHPVIRADFGQLRQAFVNILLNAVEAMPRGGRLIVHTEVPRGGREVVVSVTDTGVGIDDEHLHRIFDPFFTTKEKGTGLGLSVVYGIIEGLGGKLEVESRVGEGTTVRMRLPVAGTAGAATASASAGAPARTS